MIDYYEPQIDLTLLGCGFLGAYHVGAIYLLEQIWPHKPYNKICGASCGGLLAALLISGIKMDKVLETAMNIIKRMRNAFKRPVKLIAMKQLVEEYLQELLPQNAHQLCNNRLGLSLTKLSWSLENYFVWRFDSRQDLIDAIVAGCFIPIWSGSLINIPKFKGDYFLDGAYSNNFPKFSLTQEDLLMGTKQIQVCPFSCLPPNENVDLVAPNDYANNSGGLFQNFKWTMKVMGTRYYVNWLNIKRSFYAMSLVYCTNYKPYLLAGYEDMKNYLLASDLLKCNKCYEASKRSTGSSKSELNGGLQFKMITPCLTCLKLLERVDSLKLDEKFVKLIEM